MVSVRATLMSNSEAFVKERFGAEAHQRVLAALPREMAAAIGRPLPESARVPLEQLVAYMESARRLLAPEEPGFFRAMGRFGGERDRSARAFIHMLPDRETSVKMLSVMWHAYYGEGQIVVVERDEHHLTARVEGFRGHPVLCERITGAVETEMGGLRAEHGRCVFRGEAACEWTLWW